VSEPTVDQLRAMLAEQEQRPGDDGGMLYVFAAGEAVPADHPAVLAAPWLFEPEPSEE
jgi:hypothetical protein